MKLYGNKTFQIRREVTLSAISDHRRGHLPHLPTTNCRRLHLATPDSDSLPLSVYFSVYFSVYLSVYFPYPFLYTFCILFCIPFCIPFPTPFCILSVYFLYTFLYTFPYPNDDLQPTQQSVQTIPDNYETFIVTIKPTFHQNRQKPRHHLCSQPLLKSLIFYVYYENCEIFSLTSHRQLLKTNSQKLNSPDQSPNLP